MNGAAILAFGAVSALGEGEAAFSVGEVGQPAKVVIARDKELEAAGLARPFVARARDANDGDRATSLLVRAALQCASNLDAVRPGWRGERVGFAVGTSSGGMRSTEKLFAGDASCAPDVPYFAAARAAASALGLFFEPATLVLGACAAATLAIGLGVRWLEQGACEVVLVGGFDAVSIFVAAGFEALRATSTEVPPRAFRLGRDGMALGEGAALIALGSPRGVAKAYIAGFSASLDAVHLTAPDRTGKSLARAAERALADARIGGHEVDLVSAHATATPFNDAAESRAIRQALGPGAHAVVHPFKSQIGHTLGAAGALETLACVDALGRGVLPAAAGEGPVDPDASVRLLDRVEVADTRVALKLSAAFGGANAALVVTKEPPRGTVQPARPVFVRGGVHIDEAPDVAALAALLGGSTDRAARLDMLTRLGLAAVAKLRAQTGPLDGAGIVVGEALATLETNYRFWTRLHERGARWVEPRRFPYTSPNAVVGEASVAFSLTGPGFAVGMGLHAGLEALAIAAQLVAAGDVDRMVVLAVDDRGTAFALLRQNESFAAIEPAFGAVAMLVTSDRGGASCRIGEVSLWLGPVTGRTTPAGIGVEQGRTVAGRNRAAPEHAFGHRALLPLLQTPAPAVLEAFCPLVLRPRRPAVPAGQVADAQPIGAGARVALLPR